MPSSAEPTLLQIVPDPVPPVPEPLELQRLPPAGVLSLWPQIRVHAARSLPRGCGRLQLDDVLQGALTGRYDVWAVGAPGAGVVAVGVSEILVFPGKRVLSMFLYAGERKRAQHLWPIVEAYARQIGCDEVQIPGPRAWGRIFPDFEEAYTVFTKAVR